MGTISLLLSVFAGSCTYSAAVTPHGSQWYLTLDIFLSLPTARPCGLQGLCSQLSSRDKGWQMFLCSTCFHNHQGKRIHGEREECTETVSWPLKPPHGRNIWHLHSHFTGFSQRHGGEKSNPAAFLEGEGQRT